MSVSTSRVDLNFAPYLQAMIHNVPLLVLHHYDTETPLSLTCHAMADKHTSPVTLHSMPLEGTNTLPGVHTMPSAKYQVAPSRLTATTSEQLHAYPRVLCPSGRGTVSPMTSYQDTAEHWSLRPTETHPGSSLATISCAPRKVENIAELPVPTVLPWRSSVDVSMYEAIPLDDWVTGSAEYDASSPSSLDTQNDSPITPGTLDGDSLYGSSFNGHPTQHDFGHSHVSAGLDEYYHSSVKHPDSLTPSWISGPINSTPHGLPSISTFFDPFGQHYIDPAALHNRVVECATASPQDVELNTVVGSTTVSKLDDSRDQTPASSAASDPTCEDDTETRQQGDEYLLDMRSHGHSYKEIKRLGGFKQAESTLRGRVRTLTKEKWERVRKPQWSAHDLVLLRRAVKHFKDEAGWKPTRRYGRGKLPWKKISDWMLAHDSTYRFAPATCAKKWVEVK